MIGGSLITSTIHRKGDKTDCSNYLGISPLSTKYKISDTNNICPTCFLCRMV